MTVNFVGNPEAVKEEARWRGYHCYSSDDVTAVEMPGKTRGEARLVAKHIAAIAKATVAYIYE